MEIRKLGLSSQMLLINEELGKEMSTGHYWVNRQITESTYDIIEEGKEKIESLLVHSNLLKKRSSSETSNPVNLITTSANDV